MLNIKKLADKYKDEAPQILGKDLEFLFLETGTYESAISPNSPLYVFRGEKGAGKSMIFRRIIQEKKNQTIGVYFVEFFFEMIDRVKRHHPSDENALTNMLFFQEEWLIQFWIQLAKKLYDLHWDSRKAPFDTGNYADIYKFLKKHDLLTKLNWVAKIIKTLSFRPEKAKLKHGETEIDLTFVKPIKAKIKSIEEVTIIQQVIELLQITPIYIVIDEIDVIGLWSETAKAQLQGLYNAVLILTRTVNNLEVGSKSETVEQPLRIRIALREDFFIASNENYVESDKLTNESMSLAWTPENLKEVVARPIRAHWGFASQEISKEKLFSEIFPDHLLNSIETFNQLAQWAKGNPRYLNKLIREILATSIRRQQVYTEKTLFEPISVSLNDIYSSISSFSNDRLNSLRRSYGFMFPRLNDIIVFLQTHSNTIFPNEGFGLYATLHNSFAIYLTEHEILKQDVGGWPGVRTGQIGEVIEGLYTIGLIGVVNKSGDELYLPTPFTLSEQIVLAPIYRPAILGYTPIVTRAPRESIQKSIDFLASTIDMVRISIGSPTRIVFQVGQSDKPLQVGQPDSVFTPRLIRYQFSCLFWGLRSLIKNLITYGDDATIERIGVADLLKETKSTYEKLSSLIKIDIKAMDTLAILLNLSSSEPLTQDLFRYSLDEPNESIYARSIAPMNTLIENLKNERFNNTFTKNLEETMSALRTILINIDLVSEQ